ncbi:GntR family transcriptional regulator [Breoghania corrubedonensis]|uniref:GntR family transcriptional regulator n=1 Tax=Breoghania corrubedonensis TaxID=665038 RepID=A0A2T5VI28_9HYPH|nr:GntR family transcriptional regulator [Breoghania corrubedonensis]PTW63411.1 GntR family transcriptional regulator [Breoghania corrubedonensis]
MADTFEFESDRAYGRIVELIFGGAVDPAKPLSERKLSERLGIGRMPVREALRKLEREGVVEVKPARGTFIRTVSADDLTEVYELRESLECLATRRAAMRGPSPALANCGARLRVMGRDPSAFTSREIDDVGTEFHDALIESAGSTPLEEMVRFMRMRFRLAFHLPRYFAHELVAEILLEHIALFEAIANRSPDTAEDLMRAHLRRGLQIRLDLDRSSPNLQKLTSRPKENIE